MSIIEAITPDHAMQGVLPPLNMLRSNNIPLGLASLTHALAAQWIGRIDDAMHYARKAIELDLKCEHHGGASEGIHIANCGAIWQLIISGFVGLDLDRPMIKNGILTKVIQPSLPSGWECIQFHIISEGQKNCVRADTTGLTAKCVSMI